MLEKYTEKLQINLYLRFIRKLDNAAIALHCITTYYATHSSVRIVCSIVAISEFTIASLSDELQQYCYGEGVPKFKSRTRDLSPTQRSVKLIFSFF